MAGLRDLLNLGPRSEAMLRDAGITTYDELERLGSVQAFLRAREVAPGVSLNLLYALEGALRDVRWDYLTPEERAELKRRAEQQA